jgi:hypothetical protein
MVSKIPFTSFPEGSNELRVRYFKQDDEVGRLVMQTINSLPSAQRATYSRLQASIRADYHATMAMRRNAEFLARLRSTIPGGSLAPHARAAPASAAARRERAERLATFIAAWCKSSMPGTMPFFEGLYAVLRLQALPAALGGAGGRRLEWEVDDAAFKEAAGRDFTLAALDVLKGVLGFEDVRAAKRFDSWSRPGSPTGTYAAIDRRYSMPLDVVSAQPTAASSGSIATTTARARAPSDPFLDRPPALSHSLGSSTARSPPTPTSELPPPQVALLVPGMTDGEAVVNDEADADDYTRIWVAPDLPDAELNTLLRLFPSFVSQRALPRFPARPEADGRGHVDPEADAGTDTDAVRYGTGRILLGVGLRSAGYHGSWWLRFIAWWKQLLGW